MSRCPECKKYLKNVTALVSGFDDILEVTGWCKKHGEVKTDDWEYWDFYPGEEGPEERTPNE